MIEGNRILAVIPARGGSRGVPGKNIRIVGNRPLIAYTIMQARAVPELDRFVVSTDCAQIKSVSERFGAPVIDRPAELATAEASTEGALLHVLDVLEAAREKPFDYIVTLEPTSPFRSPQTIRDCCRKIIETGGSSLLTVRETRTVIGRINDGIFRPLVPGQPRRRQDREPFYLESSTVYVCRVDHLRRTGSLVAPDWVALVVPDREAIDINTFEDLDYVDFLMQRRNPEA